MSIAPLKLLERTHRIDALVAAKWPALDGVAVVAVGGYGRGELFPFSDIDLLFLSKRQDLARYLAPFLRELWDAGLRISQSVHTVEECLAVDEQNIELAISLLDRRFLLGDEELFSKLRDPRGDRLIAGLARLVKERHAKYSNTVFHLEPNVKDAPGGLRDVHVLRWLAQLAGTEDVFPTHDFVMRIRNELHEAAGRDQNILNFEMQDQCARTLEFSGPADLMRAYYREAGPIHRLTLRRLDEATNRRSSLLGPIRRRASWMSKAEFPVVNGKIALKATPQDSETLIRLFTFQGQHGWPLSYEAEERIQQTSIRLSGWDGIQRIFESPFAAVAVRAMHDTGVLRRLFPDLEHIESLVVRDYYHRYTVEEHTLVAIETAGQLRRQKDAFGELARETSPYSLLLLALLFHDAGKGSADGNHAESSALVAADAMDSLGVGAEQRETVLFLIRAHLEMSRLMLTRNVNDQATAGALAQVVGTVERLKLLTALTYCDISAVNPEALTPWRATLLWQLYVATARFLTQGLQNDIAAEGMPARYALVHSAQQIAEHHRMETVGQVAKIERLTGAYRLTVVAKDRPYLFAHVAGALASFGMNILHAEAFGNERHVAIETFTFFDPMRTLDLNPSEFQRLERVVTDAVLGRSRVEDMMRARLNPRRRHRGAEKTVAFDNGASERATLFEITTADRPGLLFDLARAISSKGCNIEVVLVDTEGPKAIDVFYVTQSGRPLTDEFATELREDLLQAAA